jgi:thiamine-phosphate pyrophosphorylase
MISGISGLYAVTPDEPDDMKLTAQVHSALLGGARLVQYRNKRAEPALRHRQAKALLSLCRRHGVPLIINDHVELALEIGADGVHLGSEDRSIAAARETLGANSIIGASCYNLLENARSAQRAGASYVAFGSFFSSSVKSGAAHAPVALLHEAKQELALPVVAIGGISHANAPRLIAAGADSVAVISALFTAADIRIAARDFNALFPVNEQAIRRRS